MYYVRMLIAHAFEALVVINKIRNDPALLKAVEACDRQTVASFNKVAARIGTAEYKMMRRVRNDVSFHYQDAIVRRAIESQSNKNPNMPLSLSVGHTPLDWHCEPGDKLVDSAVVRQIFEVPEGADVREEVDRIVVRIYELATDLSEFAGYFIRHTPVEFWCPVNDEASDRRCVVRRLRIISDFLGDETHVKPWAATRPASQPNGA